MLSHHFSYFDGELIGNGIPIQEIAQTIETPFYLYSAEHLRHQYHIFEKALLHYFKKENLNIAFAVKSCSNIHILKILAEKGAGADIVSGGELLRALKAGIDPRKIMFSGVGKSKEEILEALKQDIGMFNVESEQELSLIEALSCKIGKKASISLRVNPDVGTSSFPGISTGKRGDKFGIPLGQIEALYHRAQAMENITIKGLDFHIGSQVLDVKEFIPAFEKMRELILKLQEKGYKIQHLDCGGGLGVPYHPQDSLPDLEEYAALINQYFGDLNLFLAFEPGRFISGNSAILVTSILYIKEDSDEWKCAIVDASMNDLMRPALYGAYHHIVPIKEYDTKEYTENYDIVGPVCETTDTFAKQYTLPLLKQGDMLAFMTAGAYGASMSNSYNTRPIIPEILNDAGRIKVIRKRQEVEQLLKAEI